MSILVLAFLSISSTNERIVQLGFLSLRFVESRAHLPLFAPFLKGDAIRFSGSQGVSSTSPKDIACPFRADLLSPFIRGTRSVPYDRRGLFYLPHPALRAG